MELIKNFPMAQLTSLGVGGPADYLCKPKSIAEIQEALRYAQSNQLPITVIGYGSNLLVTDKGIRGMVIQLAENFASAAVEGTRIRATAGCLFSSVSKLAAYHGLTGLEFAVGIPGSLGGAIYMNAGAYDGEIGPLVEEVTWVTADEVGVWTKSEFTYSYRHSRVQTAEVIVAEAVLQLQPGDQGAILAKMKELQARRKARQPLDQPTAGSTFKRPPGLYVGPLIEEANLKGFSIGGAQVSTKHAGFIVNTGGATAQDVLDLIAHIQKTIKTKYNVDLQPELRIIGEQ
ncbi:MAG: UDP-N-acetylmuramate dehydrogenase [Firmicutes bacterium]|nr:UDP-N-acetylmuramate dehydrogenase [Bacillota bacterium]